MDLRKLKHATVLSEEGNFARAARRLNITQPALTRSIQSLEASLALRLFDRLGSGVRPTADGLHVLDHAAGILRLEAGLRREAAMLSRGESGSVAFGTGPMLAPVISSLLGGIMRDARALDVRVEIETVQNLAALLLADKIDFYVADVSHALLVEDFFVTVLSMTEIGLYVRSDHPLATVSEVSSEELKRYTLASPALGEINRTGAIGDSIATIECAQVGILKELILSSNAVLLGMGLAMQPELDAGRIVALSQHLLPTVTARVGVVERRGTTRSASANKIIDEFAAALRSFSMV